MLLIKESCMLGFFAGEDAPRSRLYRLTPRLTMSEELET